MVTIRYNLVCRHPSHTVNQAAVVTRTLKQKGWRPDLPHSRLNHSFDVYSPAQVLGFANDGEKTYPIVALDAVRIYFPSQPWEFRALMTKLVSWSFQGSAIFSGQTVPSALNWGTIEPSVKQQFFAFFEIVRTVRGHSWMALCLARALKEFVVEMEKFARDSEDVKLVFELPRMDEVEPFFTTTPTPSVQSRLENPAGRQMVTKGGPGPVYFRDNAYNATSQVTTIKQPPTAPSASRRGSNQDIQRTTLKVRSAGQPSTGLGLGLGSSAETAMPSTQDPHRPPQSNSASPGPAAAVPIQPASTRGAPSNAGHSVAQTANPVAPPKLIVPAFPTAPTLTSAPSTCQTQRLPTPAPHASGGASKCTTEGQVLERSEDHSVSRSSIRHGNLYQEAKDRGYTGRGQLSGSRAALIADMPWPDTQEPASGAFRSATDSAGALQALAGSSNVHQLSGTGVRSATAAAASDPSAIQDLRASQQDPPVPFTSYYDAMRPSTKDLTLRALEPPSSPPSVSTDDVSSPPPRKVNRKASSSRISMSSTRQAPPVVPQVMTGDGHPQFGGLTTIKKRPLDTVTNTGKSKKARKRSGRLDDDKLYKP